MNLIKVPALFYADLGAHTFSVVALCWDCEVLQVIVARGNFAIDIFNMDYNNSTDRN